MIGYRCRGEVPNGGEEPEKHFRQSSEEPCRAELCRGARKIAADLRAGTDDGWVPRRSSFMERDP